MDSTTASPPQLAEWSEPLAPHFTTPAQQFASGTLGLWLFLATEILLFSGLFCLYAVYRGLHPEVFQRAHEYLDKTWGAINTIVLLGSSFTMAWAVHAAQRSRRRTLMAMLSLTLLGGLGFLGIKLVEYKHKWEHHLLWGAHFDPHGGGEAATAALAQPVGTARPARVMADHAAATMAGTSARWEYEPAASGPRGLMRGAHPDAIHSARSAEVKLMFQFFGIYFAMTGLHGLHVVAGLAVIGWLLVRAGRGDFSAAYFTPVDLGGLYWHLVDIIWVFLFPLLYLIH